MVEQIRNPTAQARNSVLCMMAYPPVPPFDSCNAQLSMFSQTDHRLYKSPSPKAEMIVLLTIYAFGVWVSFYSWHEEGALLKTSPHDGQKTEKLKKNLNFLQVSQIEGLFACTVHMPEKMLLL